VTTCLLCPSPAVADSLCVEDGARKWAADGRSAGTLGTLFSQEWNEDQLMALLDVPDAEAAQAFLDKLAAATATRAAAPLCSRGCMSHEDE
jgi:hypothetical protein